MPNIQPEINAFNSAVYGKDVRTAIVNLANKLNDDLDDALEHEFVEVDSTLTVSGQGADAAVVGDKLIAYKNLDPADYNNKFANVNTSCLSAKNSDFADLPGSGEYVLLNARFSYNYNVQFALGYAASDKNFYWRIVNRNDGSVFVDWTTDNLNLDTTLSVTGAAADAAAVGTALMSKADASNAVIDGSISMGRAGGSTTGHRSVACGGGVEASGDYSVAFGDGATASGISSLAEGVGGTASGYAAHAEGRATTAQGDVSHAEGWGCAANGIGSHAEGWNTIASGQYQHVEGQYNEADTQGKYAHIIGGGFTTDYPSQRKNISTVDWSGNGWFAGGVEMNDTATGTRYRITIENGAIKLTAV